MRTIDFTPQIDPPPLSAAELDYLQSGLIKVASRMTGGQLRALSVMLEQLSEARRDDGVFHHVECYA